MFGFKRAPSPAPKPVQNTGDQDNAKQGLHPGKRTSSEPMLLNGSFDDDDDYNKSSAPASKDKYKNGFRDSGGLENQSVQELENYAVYKAEETTKSVDNCLRIAEDIRQEGTRTLDMLHAQGEQITRTHEMAVDMDKDLSRGEKLLNSLGGMFSKTWKPKKTREINGPVITADKSAKGEAYKREQREKLGLGKKGRSAPATPPSEPTGAMQKVEVEKNKQDDALSDLSDILGDLKGMAVDMGGEIDRQNKALDHLSDDVDELNSRVKGANQRARHLLQK